jgi:hypothetical protein
VEAAKGRRRISHRQPRVRHSARTRSLGSLYDFLTFKAAPLKVSARRVPGSRRKRRGGIASRGRRRCGSTT